MATRSEEIDADLEEIHGEAGVTVTWSGTDYIGAIADPNITLNLESGGFSPDADFVVKFRRSVFTGTPPSYKALFTINGTGYRVAGINDKPGSPILAYSLTLA